MHWQLFKKNKFVLSTKRDYPVNGNCACNPVATIKYKNDLNYIFYASNYVLKFIGKKIFSNEIFSKKAFKPEVNITCSEANT